ncbi:MAG: hypothetical protein AAB966_04580 [Patescibacteria group bacterium]
MAEETPKIKNVGEEWIKVLEKMKGINFFPYLVNAEVKGVEEPIIRENCADDNHCGKC